MGDVYGLDFGTTNSLAAVVLGNQPRSLLDEGDLPHPSMVWFHGERPVVGRRAKQRLGDQEAGLVDDVVRSPKRLLGREDGVFVAGVEREPAEIVAHVLRHLRTRAAREAGFPPLDRAVVSVPVTMRGAARRQLRDAALRAGLRIEQFVHEPLAALYGYLRSQPDFRRRLAELEDRLALVVDWGGGTLDLTLCTFVDGALVQVQNQGDDTVGGDRFDERLLALVRERHRQQHALDRPGDELPGAAAVLLERCELAKIALSESPTTTVFVKEYLRSDGPEGRLDVTLTRSDIDAVTRDLIDAGLANIDALLDRVGRSTHSIALCLPTGGMTEMPIIKERLLARFDAGRVATGYRGDLVIAEGTAWVAHDDLRLRLAKPFEVLHADDYYYPIMDARTSLPRENRVISQSLGMYCVDPRDGMAHFQLARPVWPGREQPGHPRVAYGALRVLVDETARPLTERVNLSVQLDSDLIATIRARSGLMGDERILEIHDLEFGLDLWGDDVASTDAEPEAAETPTTEHPNGAVRLRSNVASSARAWHLVPGEVVERYRPGYFDPLNRSVPQRQRDESMYYRPCSICDRTIDVINMQGCERAGCKSPTPEQARELRERMAARRAELDGGIKANSPLHGSPGPEHRPATV